MGTVTQSGPQEAALGVRERERRRAKHTAGGAAASAPAAAPAADEARSPGAISRAVRAVIDYLPKGNTLDEKTFRHRHHLLCWILAAHVPALFILGVVRGYDPGHVAVEVAVPAAAVLFAWVATPRHRLASFFTTFGLVYCSVVLVHLSGGMIEAHFHFFILIGLIALYQDWVPFLWNVIFTVVSHWGGSSIAADLIFNHTAGQNRPWTWALVHGVAVLAACAGVVVFWKNTEDVQRHNIGLAADLAASERERQEAMSGLLVNLARRNQSLLNRQLEVITDLELREQTPDVLEDLFRLDHLATRIRRNAESLLVLSGDDPPRRWGNPVPLADVVRAAAAEVEDYRRVEVLVNDHIDVAGRAVADLAHLLAELIENATTFSPPTSEVRIRSHLSPGEATRFVVTIEDIGIGMSDDDIQAANKVLAEAPEVDLRRATMLGFHVVARLAHRYDVVVRLAPTPGGGLTALVSLPRELISDRPADAPPPAPTIGAADRYHRAALAWSGTSGPRPELANAASALSARPWFEAEIEPNALPERAHTAQAPAWLEAMPVPEWLTATPPAPTTPSPAGAAPGSAATDAGRPALPGRLAPPATPGGPAPTADPSWLTLAADAGRAGATPEAGLSRPRMGPVADPVLPGTRLGPVADWVDVPATPRRGPATPDQAPTATPAEPATTNTWWAALVVTDETTTPERRSAWPSPGARSAPVDVTATPAAPPVIPPVPGDGLARRVPGSHLAPALRRDAEHASPAADSGGRDVDRVRAMLSRFQASQHAGRVAADPPVRHPPEETR